MPSSNLIKYTKTGSERICLLKRIFQTSMFLLAYDLYITYLGDVFVCFNCYNNLV